MAVINYLNAPKVKAPTAAQAGGKAAGTVPSAPRAGSTATGGTPSWNLPAWNQPAPTAPTYNQGKPINQGPTSGGGMPTNFWEGAPNMWNPTSFGKDGSDTARYVQSMLPAAQFGQNAFQYRSDFNEAQRRYNADFGQTQARDTFQMGLSQRQQQSAEEQARVAAQQWGQQFGHTQNMDMLGYGLSQQQLGLQGQEIGNTGAYQRGLIGNQANLNNFQNQYWQGQNANDARQIANQFTQGMDQNKASRDVANTYAGSNRYQADQQRIADMYGANQQLAGQLGSANIYGGAQRYQSDQQRIADMFAANRGVDVAGVYGGAQRYGADQQLAGNRYLTDAQERMNQAQMLNNLAVANTNAYGRSAKPNATWARGWG